MLGHDALCGNEIGLKLEHKYETLVHSIDSAAKTNRSYIHQLQALVHSTDNESLQQLRPTEATLHTIHYFQSLLIRQPIATPTQTAAITT